MRAFTRVSAIEHQIIAESLRRVVSLRPDVAMVMAEILEANERKLARFTNSLTRAEAMLALNLVGEVIAETGEHHEKRPGDKKGGPLRNWSDGKTTLTPMSHHRGGFVGAYVCERCLGACDGVYLAREEPKWLCGACKGAVANKQKQPAGLTRQIVWGDRAKHFPCVPFSCTVQSAEP